MLIKMDSEAFVAASLLWVDLIVIHHKTSDTLRLALYQIIGRNWQNYEQGIMSQPQISCRILRRNLFDKIGFSNTKWCCYKHIVLSHRLFFNEITNYFLC